MKGRRGGKRPAAKAGRFFVLTGLSGSGKSQAIRALEDLGYFCVDNLPTTLIPTLAKLSLRAGAEIEKVAIVVDVREGGFLSSFPKIFRKLRTLQRLNPILIFLEASNAVLVRRFSETRRPHPLAPGRSVSEGIREERARMTAIRDMADAIVDTSDMTVHELRQFFMGLSRDRSSTRLVITLLSFGFKHGGGQELPDDRDWLYRGPAPLGDDRRAPAQGARLDRRRTRARAAPGHWNSLKGRRAERQKGRTVGRQKGRKDAPISAFLPSCLSALR